MRSVGSSCLTHKSERLFEHCRRRHLCTLCQILYSGLQLFLVNTFIVPALPSVLPPPAIYSQAHTYSSIPDERMTPMCQRQTPSVIINEEPLQCFLSGNSHLPFGVVGSTASKRQNLFTYLASPNDDHFTSSQRSFPLKKHPSFTCLHRPERLCSVAFRSDAAFGRSSPDSLAFPGL
jgi:hypothetical protein